MFIKYITILSHKEHNSLTGYHHYSTFWIIHIFWLHFPFFGFNTFSPEHSMRISSTKCFAQKPFLSFKAILDRKVLNQFFLSICVATIYDFYTKYFLNLLTIGKWRNVLLLRISARILNCLFRRIILSHLYLCLKEHRFILLDLSLE